MGLVLTLVVYGSKGAVLLALGLCDDEELMTLTHRGNASWSWRRLDTCWSVLVCWLPTVDGVQGGGGDKS